MKKGIIMGKKCIPYTDKKTGEAKEARTLYVLWEEPSVQRDGCEGAEVQELPFVPFDISRLHKGDLCEFKYDLVQSGNGTRAFLAGIEVLGKAKVMIELPKA